ncbi:hypothetical protein DPEC_G00316650 [Dallia pectoralis]|uniref:Uncharacterized protein n=1 Tax=Dallia pectoralis TaxID=75939 RepID=A0ACC2FD10_DALPE|nr:hypothetical protein DPEC_G00316650 [Dallia pectoralis]
MSLRVPADQLIPNSSEARDTQPPSWSETPVSLDSRNEGFLHRNIQRDAGRRNRPLIQYVSVFLSLPDTSVDGEPIWSPAPSESHTYGAGHRFCINGLPLESKTQTEGKEELQWEIRISAADPGQTGRHGYSSIFSCTARWLTSGAGLCRRYVLSGERCIHFAKYNWFLLSRGGCNAAYLPQKRANKPD